MVDSPHGKEVTFTIRSAPVGYAAEYLTRGSFAPRIAPASRLGQRPRGICDSHGLFLAHVYLLHIIPLSTSTRSTRSTRLTIPHSSLFVYLVYSRLLGAPLRGSRSLGFLDFVSLSGSILCVLCVLCGRRFYTAEPVLFIVRLVKARVISRRFPTSVKHSVYLYEAFGQLVVDRIREP